MARTFVCDVCGKTVGEGEIGRLPKELQGDGCADICRACNSIVLTTMGVVEQAKRKEFVEPLQKQAQAEDARVRAEFVYPAGKCEIAAIRKNRPQNG